MHAFLAVAKFLAALATPMASAKSTSAKIFPATAIWALDSRWLMSAQILSVRQCVL